MGYFYIYFHWALWSTHSVSFQVMSKLVYECSCLPPAPLCRTWWWSHMAQSHRDTDSSSLHNITSSHVSGVFFHLLCYNFQSKTFTFIMKHSSVFLYDSSLYVFVTGIYINKLYMWEYCIIKQKWYSNMFYMWRIIWRRSKTIWSLPFSKVSLTLRSSRILRITLHRTAQRDLHWEI